jgi:hypothetical protein
MNGKYIKKGQVTSTAGAISLLALLLTGFIYTPVAFASLEFQAENETYPISYEVTGSQSFMLESEKGSTTLITNCNVKATGKLSEPEESIIIDPTYSGCVAKGSEGAEYSATVNASTCGTEIKIVEGKEETATGTTSIGPSGCGPIKLEVPARECAVEISSQGPFSGANFVDESKEGMETKATMDGKSSKRKCEIGCPHMAVKEGLDITTLFKDIRFLWESATGTVSTSPPGGKLKFNAVGEKKKFAIENRIGSDLFVKKAEVTGMNKGAFKELVNTCANMLYTAMVGKCEPEIELLEAGKIAPFEIKQRNLQTVTLTLEG